MSKLIRARLRIEDGGHSLEVALNETCVRISCTCDHGADGFPCTHKLDLLTSVAHLQECSDEEGLEEYLEAHPIFADMEDREFLLKDLVRAEEDFPAAEDALAEARREKDPDHRQYYVDEARDLLRDARQGLAEMEKEARAACNRIVRLLNGCAPNGRPVSKGWPESSESWPEISPEWRRELEDRFFQHELVRVRGELRERDRREELRSVSGAGSQTVSRSRNPSRKPQPGCGCGSAALVFIPALVVTAYRALL
jgi:hypothetical protein